MRPSRLFAATGLLAAVVGVGAVAQPAGGPDAAGREVARLQKALSTVNADAAAVGQRLTPLRGQLDQLQEKVKAIAPPKVPPPPEEKPEERKAEPPSKLGGPAAGAAAKKDVAEKEFRLALSRTSTRKTNVAVVCEGGKVYLVELSGIGDQFKKVLDGVKADSQKKTQLLTTGKLPAGSVEIAGGDYNVKALTLLAFPVDGGYDIDADVEFERKRTAAGLTAEQLKAPRSAFHTRLDRLKPDENIIQFNVYPDSYEVFQAARRVVWDWKAAQKFEVGWIPMPVGKPLVFGGGNATGQ